MERQVGGILYLSSEDVARSLPGMSEMIALVEEMFRQKALGRVELPPKLGLHPSGSSFMHAMPAAVESMRAVGVKWVSACPQEIGSTFPQISGQIILNHPTLCYVEAILDCALITATRTAAASILAARHLARSNSSLIGILGCGVQGRSHLAAFMEEFPVREVIAYDVANDVLDAFVHQMSDKHGIYVRPASHPREAVETSDIVLTAGPITDPPHATIQAGWLQEGTCGISIDYASYWHAAAVDQMDWIYTDDIAQFRNAFSGGQRQQMPDVVFELASLIVGTESGRTNLSDRTFACNLGIASEDMVVARAVVERAKRLDIGRWLPR